MFDDLELFSRGDLRCALHLPAGHDDVGRTWPVLVHLHGMRECGRPGDDAGTTKQLLTTHGPLGPRPEDRFIVVALQVPCAAGT